MKKREGKGARRSPLPSLFDTYNENYPERGGFHYVSFFQDIIWQEYASLFFVGITVGRAFSGFLTMRWNDARMVRLGRGDPA